MSSEESASVFDREIAAAERITLRYLGSVFATRERAAAVFRYTEGRLGSHRRPAEIDLEGITGMSDSFIDEYLGKIASACLSNGEPPPTILNASEEIRTAIERVMKLRGVECEFSGTEAG